MKLFLPDDAPGKRSGKFQTYSKKKINAESSVR